MNSSSKNILTLCLRAETLRKRMHRMASKHGVGDPRVLRISKALDKVVAEIMRLENEVK